MWSRKTDERCSWRQLPWKWLVALVFLIPIGRVEAHPNILMNYRVLLNFQNHKIDAIGESWTFDQTFSQTLLDTFDTNHDGKFDTEESSKMGDTVLANLADADYFTYLWSGPERVEDLVPSNFTATLARGVVTFAFTMVLPSPISPAHVRLEIKDPDFVVLPEPTEQQPVLVRGDTGDCVPKVSDAPDAFDFSGAFPQDQITVRCN
ncbi:DUF1007 family protein [Amorphus sp. 3PC139-8]